MQVLKDLKRGIWLSSFREEVCGCIETGRSLLRLASGERLIRRAFSLGPLGMLLRSFKTLMSIAPMDLENIKVL